MVDVTDLDHVELGDEAVLIGRQGETEITKKFAKEFLKRVEKGE